MFWSISTLGLDPPVDGRRGLCVCAASVRSEGCSSAERLGHAVIAGGGPKGGQGSRMQLAALGEKADEVSFFGIADEGRDAKGVAETAFGHAPAPP